jgi:hypothetical protein
MTDDGATAVQKVKRQLGTPPPPLAHTLTNPDTDHKKIKVEKLSLLDVKPVLDEAVKQARLT